MPLSGAVAREIHLEWPDGHFRRRRSGGKGLIDPIGCAIAVGCDEAISVTIAPAIVSDIGQLLESARHLFEFGREAFDPIGPSSYRSHQNIIRR